MVFAIKPRETERINLAEGAWLETGPAGVRPRDHDINAILRMFPKKRRQRKNPFNQSNYTVPRKEFVMGDEVGYVKDKYSENIMSFLFCGYINKLRLDACDMYKKDFTIAIANLYENGQDYVAPHADDEKLIDQSCPIVTYSFGESRIFRIRDAKTNEVVKTLNTGCCTFITMGGNNFQSMYKHEIVKQSPTKVPGARISITFRKLHA